jgi:hypothetical protein
LFTGGNFISVIVSSENGMSQKTYTLLVHRAEAPRKVVNAYASLSSLSLSTGAMDQVFRGDLLEYTQTVANDISSVRVTAVAAQDSSEMTLNGNPIVSAEASDDLTLSLGKNVINVVSRSEDRMTVNHYSILIHRLARADSLLSNLEISAGALSPTFSSDLNDFNISVDNSIDSIVITPTANDIFSTMQVNGSTVLQGHSSDSIALDEGDNLIEIYVTAQDGTTQKNYSLTVTRQGTANVSLKSVALSSGVLTPSFSPTVTSYKVTVDNTVPDVVLTPVTDATPGTTTLDVNGDTQTSGADSQPVTLPVGETDVKLVVNSNDGLSSKAYVITVDRVGDAVADLLSLDTSVGELTPAFSRGTTEYAINVGPDVTYLQLTPSLVDTAASVKVHNVIVPTGTASGSILLNLGNNPIDVLVTATDGNTKNYRINVNRQLAGNADLSSLTLRDGQLTPLFNPQVMNYEFDVAYGVTSFFITPTLADANASLQLNGVTRASGLESWAIPLDIGANAITVLVTAQDTKTQKTYQVTVNRQPANNANLERMFLSAGVLSPGFVPGQLDYTALVPHELEAITLTAKVEAEGAVIRVNGDLVNSAQNSQALPLNVGANVISVEVTSEDGSVVKPYQVTVTRAASDNVNLLAVNLSAGTLTPVFSSDMTTYSTTLAHDISSVTVSPILDDSGASMKVNGIDLPSGQQSMPLSLNVGSNNITIAVTAADGSTSRNYSVAVIREADSNSSLGTLKPYAGGLNPIFDSNHFSYVVNVPNDQQSMAFTLFPSDPSATVKINGVSVQNATRSALTALQVGGNYFHIVVTAADGQSTSTYNIEVTREDEAEQGYLSDILLSEGNLSPAFSTNVTTYTASVTNYVSTIQVTPVATSATASITVNGHTVSSGSTSREFPLAIGENTISTVVSDQDGSFQTYNVFVTRRGNDNADLMDLAIDGVRLTPGFHKNTTMYRQSLPYYVTSVGLTAISDDAYATIRVNGNVVVSGDIVNVAIGEGETRIEVILTAENGAQKTYTIALDRLPRPAEDNADLYDLEISNVELDTPFDTQQTAYNISAGYLMSGVRIKPSLMDLDSTVRINGTLVNSGEYSDNIALAEGNGQILIDVTARDGVSATLYTINYSRRGANEFANRAYVKASNSGAGDKFGNDVDISGDVMVVGAPYEDGSSASDGLGMDNNVASNAGAAYVFVRDGLGNWSQQAYLKPDVLDANDNFGIAVAVDGDTIVVGATGDDANLPGVNPSPDVNGLGNSGAAYVYVRDGEQWVLDAKLKAAHLATNYKFGISLDISEDTVIVGAPGDDSNSSSIINGETSVFNYSLGDSGAAYIFARNPKGVWQQQAYLKSSNPSSNDQFGISVAIDKDSVVVGAHLEDTSFWESGAAYVFVREQGLWSQQAMLKASNVQNHMKMARSVDIHGDTVVAGSTKEDTTARDSGAAYVFIRDNHGSWSQQAQLKAANAQAFDQMGLSVAIHGGTIAVGAITEDSNLTGIQLGAPTDMNNSASNSGAVYVFTRDGSSWTQQAYVKATNPGANDQFGHYLSLDGDVLGVSSYLEDGNGVGISPSDNNSANDAGAVYIYH